VLGGWQLASGVDTKTLSLSGSVLVRFFHPASEASPHWNFESGHAEPLLRKTQGASPDTSAWEEP
jgi:hypothetical protein